MSSTVRSKAWWWSLVPFAGRQHYATTLGRTIYLTPRMYEDFTSPHPSVSIQALVLHEEVHVTQYENAGVWFALRYLFSRKARRDYEVEAYARQGAYLKRRGYTDIEGWAQRRAEALASWRYFYAGKAPQIQQMILETIEQDLASHAA